jgi:hypothetical protein
VLLAPPLEETRMKSLKLAALCLILGSGLSVADDCVQPEMPTIPDGSTSSLEQMLEGQQGVKTFQAANLEYMSCIEAQLSAAEARIKEGDADAMERYTRLQETYNAAVSREEEVAGQFNTEIREYKAANPG